MEKNILPRKLRIYVPLMCIFMLFVFLMPRSPKFNYDYSKGSPWMYETMIAQFDFPLIKTQAQFGAEREKAWTEVVPFYRHDPLVAAIAARGVASADLEGHESARVAVASALKSVYAKGLLPDRASKDVAIDRSSDGMIYIQKDMRAEKVPVTEVYDMERAGAMLREAIAKACPHCNADSVYVASGLSAVLVPDLVYDQQTTDLIHRENVYYVSPTRGVVISGQTIVSNGEIVTAEIEQMLDSYKAEYDRSVGYDGPRWLQWAGNAVIALLIVMVLFFAIYYCNYRIFDSYNKYLYILMVFTLSAAASFAVARMDPSMFYLVPFTLIALYLQAFFTKKTVFTIYLISLIPMLMSAPNGVELYVMYVVAGVVGIFVFDYFNKGWLQFVTAFIVFVVMLLVWGAFRVADGIGSIRNYSVIWYLALGAFMSVAGYPLIYLFEKMFMLVSSSKLVELSDTSNKLLRMLADKAPGTFQHCLQVMNLADAAARSIDANVPLVRAGALYHDVGKICNPQCFTENETPGVKYHAGLTPKESAQEIIRHVSDGLALAEKHNLPGVLKDFIRTHHGTTAAAYFLNKYLSDGGDPEDVSDFYYDGVRPVTKEQVILMLCDAVEAASRSLKDYSPENISELVDRIIDGKSDDGQLADSDISLREIATIKEVLKSYLQQMYHSRVVYPKRKIAARK